MGIIGIVIVDAVHSLRTSECDVDGLLRSMVSFRVVNERGRNILGVSWRVMQRILSESAVNVAECCLG